MKKKKIVKFVSIGKMPLNLNPSQVVEVYVQIIGGEVGVALLFAPKNWSIVFIPK
jgi:hypothetical protein